MSNTTALGDKAICKQLSATQLGSVSKPIDTAYIQNIIPHPSLSTPNLQNVCNEGNITTTSIQCGGVNSTGLIQTAGAANIYSDGTLVAQGDITSDTGNITATAGDIVATAGDITATAGNISATAGRITCFGQILTINGEILASNGDITATNGDITATAGGITAGGEARANKFVDTGGTNEFGTIDLSGGITAPAMSSVLIEVPNINATTNLQALAGQIAVNLQVGGTILSQAIDNTYRVIANGLQTRQNIWDVGTTTSLTINSVDDPSYVLLTTTTGTQLSTTLTLTLPNTDITYEGALITIDGSGMAPAISPATMFNITASYTSQLVGGGSPVAESLPINGLTTTTIGRLRIKRDSNGRLKWVQDT